jgi:hypothetical protein
MSQIFELTVPALSQTQCAMDDLPTSEHKDLIDLLSMDPYDFPVILTPMNCFVISQF